MGQFNDQLEIVTECCEKWDTAYDCTKEQCLRQFSFQKNADEEVYDRSSSLKNDKMDDREQ